jgi:hypothetical protein
MPVCDFCKEMYENEHECPVAETKLCAVIGIVSHYIPLRKVGQLQTVSKSVSQAVQPYLQRQLQPAREMWEHNNAFNTAGQTKVNFINEGLAARLLKAISPTYVPWDGLPQETKDQLSQNFKSKTSTPDYVMTFDGVRQVGDCFSVNHPAPPNGVKTAAMSKRAIETSFPAKLTDKWDKYGKGSFAVAWLQGFPDEVSTSQILEWIAAQCAQTFPAYREKQNRLFLVRDPLVKAILI